MKFLIETAAGVVTDYTHYVIAGTPNIQDSINVPTLLSFQMGNVDSAFVCPPAGSYITVQSELYFQTPYSIQVPAVNYPWSPTDPTYPFVTSGGVTPSVSIPLTEGQSLKLKWQSGTISYGAGSPPITPAGLNVIPPDPTNFPAYGRISVNPYCLVGGFANAEGNLIALPFYIGDGPITIGPAPVGTTQILIGMNDWPYDDNTGAWTISVTLVEPKILFTGFITSVPERTFLGLSTSAGSKVNAAGQSLGYQTYQYNVQATSDEWLLNCKVVPFIPAFVNQTDSQILESIAEALCPGMFDFSQMATGVLVPYFAYDPSQTWSDIAKTFADQNRYYYKVQDFNIIYQPFGDEGLGIAYDDTVQREGQLAPFQLTTTLVTVPPVNDCVVIGDIEPQANWDNYFCGDGFTSNFQLVHQVFQGTSSTLLQDDWTETTFAQGTWIVNDPANVQVLADSDGNAIGALNVVQSGTPGVYLPIEDATYIQAQNGLELGGGINLQHGSVTFNDFCNGMIGAVYAQSTEFTPAVTLCSFGITGQQNLGTYTVVSVQILQGNSDLVNLTINGTAPTSIQPGNVLDASLFTNASFLNGNTFTVESVSQGVGNWVLQVQGQFIYVNPYGPTSDSGQITFPQNAVYVTASGAAGVVIQPIFSGAYVGPKVVTQVNHQYTLQTWIGAEAPNRYTRPYTNLTQTATYGDQFLTASGTLTWVITDTDLGDYVIQEQNPLFGLFPAAPPPVVTQFTLSNLALPPFGVYCLTNCINLNISLNYTLLGLPPQGYLTVQSLTGASGGNLPWLPAQLSQPIVYQLGVGQINQTAQISQSGQAYALAFYTDDIPSVGARIRFQSWAAGQSIARVTDPINIAQTAIISGDDGVRSAIMNNLSPLPLTSDECEAAAAAAILDRENPQFQGTYTVMTVPYRYESLYSPSLYDYPRTGRFLWINALNRGVTGQNFITNTITTSIVELKSEVLQITVDYGPDLYLEKLLPAFLERDQNLLEPTQSVPAPNPITLDQVLNAYLPTLDNAQIIEGGIVNYGSSSITTGAVGVTGGLLGQSYVTVNLGAPPITACEVRNVDSGWGVADQGRVGLFTTQTFTLPRTIRDQTWYLRALNGALFSRFSKVLRVVYPMVPSAPTLIAADANAIVFDYAGDVRDIYGLEVRATPVSGVQFVEFPDVPEDEFAQLTRIKLEVPTDGTAAGMPVLNNGNVTGIYNPPQNQVPFPFPYQLDLGDIIYVTSPSDSSFGGVQLVTNVLTATGNSGIVLPPGISFNNAVAFFMENNSAFNGAFAYEYPIGPSNPPSGIQAIASLQSLEMNYGPGVGNFYDPNVQPAIFNKYDVNGNFLGTWTPWSGATQGWCMAITGNIVIPSAGSYPFTLEHDDGAYLSMGGGATYVSGPKVNISFSTSAAANLPVMGGTNESGYWGSGFGGGGIVNGPISGPPDVIVISFPAAGEYPFEIDYAQWYNQQTLGLTTGGYTGHIYPGTVIPPSSGAPWGIGWFDYGEPYIDQIGNASFGVNTDIATVQLYNRGPYSVCASGSISGGYTGIATIYTELAHNFTPGQQVIVGAGWKTFPQSGYPPLPNSGSIFTGYNLLVTAVPSPTSFQYVITALTNPSLSASGSNQAVLAQIGVHPQQLNGLCAAMPTPFTLAASSGVIIQRPVFAPSDLVIDLTQPDIAETFGILQTLSPGGRVQGLSAYFFNLTWDYSAETSIPSLQVPALTGVFINEQTQQIVWNLQQGYPDGYRIDITDPNTGQLYNQFTIDHPYNPILLTQFQMSNVDFSQNRNITITPFDIAGDGVPITVYHPAGTVTQGGGGGTNTTPQALYSITDIDGNFNAPFSQPTTAAQIYVSGFNINFTDYSVGYAGPGLITVPGSAYGGWFIYVNDPLRNGTLVTYGVTNDPADLVSDTIYYIGRINLSPYGNGFTEIGGSLPGTPSLPNAPVGTWFVGPQTGVPEPPELVQGSSLVFQGDSGSGGTIGLVPAPPAGSAYLSMFLSASGSFAVPIQQISSVSGSIAFGCTWQGALTASGIIFHLPMALGEGAVTFPVNMAGSSCHLLTAPAASVTIPIYKDGTTLISNMLFASGANWGTFSGPSSPVTLIPPVTSGGSGDYITVVLPSTQDSTASDLGFQLIGTTTPY